MQIDEPVLYKINLMVWILEACPGRWGLGRLLGFI